MIVEWLVQVSTGFASWVATLFPPLETPTWFPSLDGVTAFLSNAAGLGAWVPYGVIATVVAGVVAVYAVSFGTKLVRAIIAHVPFIGGSG